MLDDIAELLDKPFALDEVRNAVPANLRPNHRIAILLIILRYCRGEKASSTQLHVLDWAIRTAQNRRLFLKYLDGFVDPDRAVVRFDPALTRAVNYALALKLISDVRTPSLNFELHDTPLKGDRIALSKKGAEVLTIILDENPTIFSDEIFFLESIGKKVTQSLVNELLEN